MLPKVFCIGFHKTGTTSLQLALTELGYKVTGPNGVRDPDIAKNVRDLTRKLVQEYDAFQDNPWPILYQELDQEYPGSKFILTIRSSDSWIKSQVKHFGKAETPMRRWIYGEQFGHPEGNESHYIKRFNDHNEEVMQYFSNRTDDLLILNLGDGIGWNELCKFLGQEIPSSPFPHANPSSEHVQATGLKALTKRIKRFTKRQVKKLKDKPS